MGRFISDNQVIEVQQATDIVELISEYIPLKKAGSNYKALCPFHDEKTPSFIVSPSKQIYHCFGCHKGGNVFTFLMASEKVGFPEAVKMLAERSGIKLVLEERTDFSEEKRAELLKINRLVADWYHKNLLESSEGEIARRYLAKRGFNQGIIGRFLLGYAKPGWDTLIDFTRHKNIPEGLLEEVGLILPRKDGRGYYDRFRNRLIFPIFNTRDRVIGFGARSLDNCDAVGAAERDTSQGKTYTEPVYLNSPEGPLFSKGKTLYGLNFAKDSARRTNTLVVVEGYTDVIMAHQMGFDWVIATLGTALTDDHLKSIRRFVTKVILVYDGDTAGEMASARTLDLFLKEDMDLLIAELPKGLDPYDCLVQKGPEVFRRCLTEAKDLFSYRLNMVKSRYNLSPQSGINEKTQAIDEMLETIGVVGNVIRRELMIKRLAEETQTRETFLRLRLKEKSGRPPLSSNKRSLTAGIPPARINPLSACLSAAEDIIELMLVHNEVIPEVQKRLSPDDFPDETTKEIYQEITRLYEKYDKVTVETLSAILSPEPQRVNRLIEIVQRERVKARSDYQKHLADLLTFFGYQKAIKTKPPLKTDEDLIKYMELYRRKLRRGASSSCTGWRESNRG